MFSGCAFMDSSFFVTISDEDVNNKYIDILIPLETNDEYYTEYNTFINGSDIRVPAIDKNSEISRYNESGYRSMLIHYNGTNVFYFNPADAHISLPLELYSTYNDPYGEEAFMDFCDKYKKCKFVVINNQGDILSISKEIKLKKFGYYLNGTTKWNTDNNRIKVSYHISIIKFLIYLFCSVISIIGVLVNIILWKIYKKCCDKGKYRFVVLSGLIAVLGVPIIIEDIISLFINSELSAYVILLSALILIFSITNILFFKFFFKDTVKTVNINATPYDK